MAKPNPTPPPLTPQRITRFWGYVDKTPGQGPQGDCWEWQKSRLPKGYGRFGIWRHETRAHRMAFYLATGTWPTLCVLHRCDNPPCCNPAHLFEGTDADNSDDKIRKHGHWSKKHPESYQRGVDHFAHRHPERILRGSRIGTSKLTEEQARTILYGSESTAEAANRFGVSISLVSLIRKRKCWKHL